MSDDLVKRYRQLQEVIGGCHDGYCVVRKPKGMHTNGGCNCLEDLRLHERSRIGGLLRCAQGMADRIEELQTGVEALQRREIDANRAAMKHLRDLEQERINSKNYAEFNHIWRKRCEEMEAKLAKAVDALEKIDVGEGWAAQIARATLAELTGGKDE